MTKVQDAYAELMKSNPAAKQMKIEMEAYYDVNKFVENILEIDWLYPAQKEILHNFYHSPNKFNELVLVCGMRAGKTLIASIVSCYEAYKLLVIGRPCKHYHLPKGQEIFIINVAVSERQAKDTIFAHVKARIADSKWFQSRIENQIHNEFRFNAEDAVIIIRSEHSKSGSLAGKTAKMVAFDEIARFNETGESSADMVYNTLSRAVKTFGAEGKKVSVSSPMYVDDYQMQLAKMGEGLPHTMVVRAPTWEINPTISFESLADEFQKNPEKAWRDYGAMPQATIDKYFSNHDKIDLCVDADIPNIVKEEYEMYVNAVGNPDFKYVLAGDPALVSDAFGMALGHEDENEIFVVDMAHRFVPIKGEGKEVDALRVRYFVTMLAKNFPIYAYATDTYQYPELLQFIKNELDIPTYQNMVNKKVYDNLKEMVYTRKIRLPNSEVLSTELKNLELYRGTKVDHPRKGSKDVADAVANIAWISKQEIEVTEIPVFASVEA